MFGISYGEVFLILCASAALIGPKDLPKITRMAGRAAGRAIAYVSWHTAILILLCGNLKLLQCIRSCKIQWLNWTRFVMRSEVCQWLTQLHSQDTLIKWIPLCES